MILSLDSRAISSPSFWKGIKVLLSLAFFLSSLHPHFQRLENHDRKAPCLLALRLAPPKVYPQTTVSSFCPELLQDFRMFCFLTKALEGRKCAAPFWHFLEIPGSWRMERKARESCSMLSFENENWIAAMCFGRLGRNETLPKRMTSRRMIRDFGEDWIDVLE